MPIEAAFGQLFELFAACVYAAIESSNSTSRFYSCWLWTASHRLQAFLSV